MKNDRSVYFVSLGCPKNRVDTEVMVGVSQKDGRKVVARPEDADLIVVNTCGFIDAAKEESIETILELAQYKSRGRCRTLVVAGCLSQRYAGELEAALPEVDHFLGSSDMLRLADVLRGEADRVAVGHPADYRMRASDPRGLAGPPHSAYVKVAEGCNRSCSFCAIPSFRGRQRSRPPDDIVREVRDRIAGGTVEVTLVSQDTVAYGRDLPTRSTLAEVTEKVAELKGLEWLRLHYLYPERLDPILVELLAHHPRVLPYVDMPLQHAADSMLRRMRRGHGGDRLRRVVDRLRTALPELVFRTSFIVGHPGESEEDFQELLSFVRWAAFDHVGVFLFSPEEGTPSASMGDAVPREVALARRDELVDLQRQISRPRLAARVGTEIEVLVDGPSEESEYLFDGRWWGQAPGVDGRVILANGTARPGEFRRAWITASADHDLCGDLLDAAGSVDTPTHMGRPMPTRRLHVLS